MDGSDASVEDLLGIGAFPHPSEERACPYLPGERAQDEVWLALRVAPDSYHELMNRNFRRSGRVLYRPRCGACTRCRQLRVPVDAFRPSRSQRRCRRRNGDLSVHVGPPRLSDEKVELYQRYLESQHEGTSQPSDIDGLREFLYATCVRTVEVSYRDSTSRLVGVSILDVCASSFSSVYHYFDPDERRRSLGVFSVLAEIELARMNGVPYYYLGYWIDGCRTMAYKANYHPHEVLGPNGWTLVEEPERG